jgi:very-short-patch-repair endonuclease
VSLSVNSPGTPPLTRGEADKVSGGDLKSAYKKRYLSYEEKNLPHAKNLRKNLTHAEYKIWHDLLKNKNFKGLKFIKQKPIENFIVDFYCATLKLAIEIDGDTHYTDEAMLYDEKRSTLLKNRGVYILRFTNDDIYFHLDAVYNVLESTVNKLTQL